jgi:hypothetical protein
MEGENNGPKVLGLRGWSVVALSRFFGISVVAGLSPIAAWRLGFQARN